MNPPLPNAGPETGHRGRLTLPEIGIARTDTRPPPAAMSMPSLKKGPSANGGCSGCLDQRGALREFDPGEEEFVARVCHLRMRRSQAFGNEYGWRSAAVPRDPTNIELGTRVLR